MTKGDVLPSPPDSVAVLNGTIRTGDTVAVAVRDGNVSAMRVGVVEGFRLRRQGYSESFVTRVLIRVTHSSDSIYQPVGRVIQVETPDRIAKFVVTLPSGPEDYSDLLEYITTKYGGGAPEGVEIVY